MNYSRLQKLISYLRPHWRQVLWGVVALLAVNAVGALIPWLIRNTLDRTDSLSQLWGSVALIFLLAAIMWVIRMLSRLWLFGVGRQVEFDLKQRLFEHLLRLEPAYFATHPSGDLISRATSDVENIRRLLGFAILSVVNTIFAYGITLPLMFALDLRLSAIALIPYPFILMTVQLFSQRLRSEQLAVQERLSELSDSIQEDMSGIAAIKIYSQEDNQRRAFGNRNRKLLNVNLKLARTRNLLFPLIEGLASISLLVLLGLGSRSLATGALSTGDFIALILYAQRLVFPIALLGFTITAYQRGEVSIDRVEAILSVDPRIQNAPDAVALPVETVGGRLHACNLNYAYPGSQTPALKQLNFTIEPGAVVAVVGTIGAGKSTLANAILRLLDLAPGHLFLDGQDITQIQLEDLRQAIAYVPQDSFLFSTTVGDNIRYGQPEASQKAIEAAAKTAQIHGEILNFPQQYDTIVGERGITLSGGQRQRTSLARALLVDAKVLILDDALSSVDNQTATHILSNLSRGIVGKTVIFITHQLSAAARADRLLVMDKGQIVQSGTHSELMAIDGLYRLLVEQHRLEENLR